MKEIKIYINSVRYEVNASLFSDEDSMPEDFEDILKMITDGAPEPEKIQIKTLGAYELDGNNVKIYYDETELTGMEGSRTTICFDRATSEIITMMRTGQVSTALVFEKGKRHHCVYNTPYMPFEVCVWTIDVKNQIEEKGLFELDYIVEIRGARAERNRFSMRIKQIEK